MRTDIKPSLLAVGSGFAACWEAAVIPDAAWQVIAGGRPAAAAAT